MMSGAKKRVPKRRFKEFLNAGEWEQRKLSELATMNARIGWQNLRTSEFLDSGDYLLITGTDFDNGRVKYSTCHYVEKKRFDQDTKIQLSTGSILITKDGTLGKVALVEELPKPATLNAGVFNVRVKDDAVLSYKYLYHYLKAPFLMKYVTANATGGTIKHLNQSILVDFPIPITEKPEQDRIAKLLDSLESSITLHQRKLDKLQATKKALLQEMFPEEGQDKPKRRFKGFTDAWEQRKLGDCMNSFAYGLNAAAKDYDGMHKYIRITDIDDETHNFIQSNLTSPDIDFNMDVSDYKLNVGDIVFARTGASVGKTYLYNPNDGDLYYAGFLIRGTVKEDCDAGFIYQNTLTKEYDSFIRITSQRSGQPGVNSKEYATFRLNIPCKDEQEKISKILHSLDELFTLHQRKLDKLKNLKQAYLNEMFV